MQRAVRPTLVLCLSLGIIGFAGAQEEPRAVIKRAIDAQGGQARLARPKASQIKIQGVVSNLEGATFTGEGWQQFPGRIRLAVRLEMNGTKREIIHVRNDDRGWMRMDGATQELDEKRLADLKRSEYVDRVTSLLDLLKDKGFTLSGLGESKVDGQAAVGVKVTSKDHPDVYLYFAKASGHLIKSRYRAMDDNEGKELTHETTYHDYRAIDYAAADERVLHGARLDVDGPALLRLFRQQTLTPADRERMAQIVRQLGAKSFRAREKASADLVALGAAAIPLLRKAAADSDVEVARRAERCLQQIDASTSTHVLSAAARLVALRQPRGTAEVLLAYLPEAADAAVAGEVQAALAAVGTPDGKPNPVLVQALTDKDPVRRAAAAAALGKDGGAYERQPGRRLIIEGLVQPMKIIHYRDGEKFLEWSITDLQFFNKLDDSVFAKP
jgi:hypothetical protein